MSVSIDICNINIYNSSQDRGGSRILLFDALAIFGKRPETQTFRDARDGEVPVALPKQTSISSCGTLGCSN